MYRVDVVRSNLYLFYVL